MYFIKVAFIGFLGADAEPWTTKNGASYTVLSLATKRSWKNTQGNYESRSYWHRAVAWGKLAAFAATLKKGSHLQLVGEVRTREYEKEYGTKCKFTVRHRVCEIALESILKLDRAVVNMAKLRNYCLNPRHARGRHKARVFASALGITQENAGLLRQALLEAAASAEATLGDKDDYGQRYMLNCEIAGPAGKGTVRSSWIVLHGQDFPRLTSCFVL